MSRARAVDRVDAESGAPRCADFELDRRLGELEQRLLQRLGEPLRDMVDELRALRQLMTPTPGPVADTPHARVMLALARTLGDLELTFTSAEVIDAAKLDHDLDAALGAVDLTSVEAFGLWLRDWRNHPLVGYIVRRDRRGWRLERCT